MGEEPFLTKEQVNEKIQVAKDAFQDNKERTLAER